MLRRNFITNMAAGSAGVFIAPTLMAMESISKPDANQLSGLLPFMLFEDCITLIQSSTEVEGSVKNSLLGDISQPVNGNISRLAGTFPNGEKQIPDLLEQLRGSNTEKLNYSEEKLSFVLGWIVHKAAAKEIVTYNQKLVKGGHSLKEITTHQDTQLIRSRFEKTQEAVLRGADVSSYLLETLARVVTRVHTLTPDKNNGGDWIMRTTNWRIKNKETMEKYGEVIDNPDPKKLDLYFRKCRFYDANDSLMSNNFKAKGLSGENHSLYAKSIINSYQAVLAIQAYLKGGGNIDSIMKWV